MGMDRKKVFDVLQSIDKDDAGWGDQKHNLLCPICRNNYQHMERPESQNSRDSYGANWEGRGDLIIVPMSGECGSKWELCLGFHKGDTVIFSRVIEACRDKSAAPPPVPSVKAT